MNFQLSHIRSLTPLTQPACRLWRGKKGCSSPVTKVCAQAIFRHRVNASSKFATVTFCIVFKMCRHRVNVVLPAPVKANSLMTHRMTRPLSNFLHHVPVTVTSDISLDYIVCRYMVNDRQDNPLICIRDPMKRDAISIFQKLLALILTVKVSNNLKDAVNVCFAVFLGSNDL